MNKPSAERAEQEAPVDIESARAVFLGPGWRGSACERHQDDQARFPAPRLPVELHGAFLQGPRLFEASYIEDA